MVGNKKKKTNIKYDEMPENHKMKWYMDDDVGGCRKYMDLITWLRVMGSRDGSVFKEIPNLNWSGAGYPLLEVEVVAPDQKSVKFMINKSDLYLIGWSVNGIGFQYENAAFRISTFHVLPYKVMYTTTPWEKVGPKAMIEAIGLLHEGIDPIMVAAKKNKLQVEKFNSNGVLKSCEVFFVHLSEAARFHVVAAIICGTLKSVSGQEYENRTYKSEEDHHLEGKNGNFIDKSEDIYLYVKGDGPIDQFCSLPTPAFMCTLIHSFSYLSKVWYNYTSSGVVNIGDKYVSELGIKSIKSLRSTLAVLCNNNPNKLSEKSGKGKSKAS